MNEANDGVQAAVHCADHGVTALLRVCVHRCGDDDDKVPAGEDGAASRMGT